VKAEGSTYIPIVDAEDAAHLLLDGKPDASYVVCALPLQPTWQPVDVTRLHALQFFIRVAEPLPADVYVCMVSQSEDGTEHTSHEISLKERGLQSGNWTNVAIPVDQFSGNGFDPKSTRLVKFVAHQTCRIELSKIYIYENVADKQSRIRSIAPAGSIEDRNTSHDARAV
jgi:hypothetical protein